MNKRKDKSKTPSERKIRRSALITVIGDIILIVALAAFLLAYSSQNKADSYNQNIKNITNIAAAKSELMRGALDNTSFEIKSAYRYCNEKTMDEILDYLNTVSDEENEYQLLKRNESTSSPDYNIYSGYSSKKSNGEYKSVKYTNTALASSIYASSSLPNGQISYSQSFTNSTDALRYFAVFCGISVEENGAQQAYYLVKPQKESKVLDQLRMYSQYTDLVTAVCYTDGKFLACDNSFKTENFFDYLYKYNNLSIDEKTDVKESVQNDDDATGNLNFKDYKQRECVFSYAVFNDYGNWIVIVAVPVSEFVSENILTVFPLIVIGFLLVLLIFNTSRLLIIVRELRRSVVRERIANTSKSSFLSRMSHEIRTPLNAVIGYNTIAKSEITEAKNDYERRHAEMKVMDCLLKSEIASKHLLTIINDVLDMSAIESGKMQVAHDRFDFKGLITSLTTVFYSQAKAKGVDFKVVLNTLTEEWFVGDQMRINQILTNLLSNAIKFTPEGGSVKLIVSQPDADTNASHIHFDIIDTGIGMSKEYLSHLWTPFEQADSSISRRFGGTGLGLSITKNLVDIMGGSISVESALGKGTTFNVDMTFERTNQPETSMYDFSGVNALVVDDDPSTCDYIRLLFNRCGAKCATVTSGKDAVNAVSLANERGEHYSICLVDWKMPGMDGIETIKQIHETADDSIPTIVLTAYDFSEISEDAGKVGVSKMLSKPLFQSSLFDLLAGINGMNESDLPKKKTIDFSGACVLLAEDNTMNMEIAKRIMESAGLVVDCAWNGKEAVEIFCESEQGRYLAILMDVHMPEMNGHDATTAIRASSHPEAKTIPIIAMTADAFTENIAEAYAAGMNGLIPKPIDINVLFQTLMELQK